ncbi:MAG: helix-turn-helix transcriptional regulator [Lachnospiraceae bacterium]|nr:helix-turn-helix transcriptional regulator [Lachnospiraceae bacterium]
MLFLVSVVVIVYSFLPFLLFIKKLTQQEFAELVNIPQPSISAYENDRNSPNMDVLINILLVSLFTEMISSIH